jgi:hypothetical protein
MSLAMSRRRHEDGITKKKEFELAEAVAAGLHSLAQPLAALQMGLELCLMGAGDPERLRKGVEDALVQLERTSDALGLVRETIRPFRPSQPMESQSLQEALVHACSLQSEALEREGIEVRFDRQVSPAEVTAAQGVIPRLAFAIVSYLRCSACGVAHLAISEQNGRIQLDAKYTGKPLPGNTGADQCLDMIRVYVSAMNGEIEVSESGGLIHMELWKNSESAGSQC